MTNPRVFARYASVLGACSCFAACAARSERTEIIVLGQGGAVTTGGNGAGAQGGTAGHGRGGTPPMGGQGGARAGAGRAGGPAHGGNPAAGGGGLEGGEGGVGGQPEDSGGAGATGASGEAGEGGSAGEGSVVSGPCGGVSYGLVAHFLADGDTSDATGTLPDATYVPASSTASLLFTTGHAGDAFQFNGDGYLTVDDTKRLSPTVGVTVATWVRVDSTPVGFDLVSKDGEGFVNHYGSDFERQYLLHVSEEDRFRAHVGTVTGFKYFDGATPVAVGVWYHVAMTYDANSGVLILFVSGEEDGRLVVPEGERCLVTTPQPLRIGGGAPLDDDPYYLDGALDDVRVYDRALSADQIRSLAAR
jgi:hypothetical protein